MFSENVPISNPPPKNAAAEQQSYRVYLRFSNSLGQQTTKQVKK